MPTVFRKGPYRFFFYSGDRGEPPHVHVQRDTMVAKFWLHPLHLALGGGFDERELRRIEALLEERAGELLEFWDEFFAN